MQYRLRKGHFLSFLFEITETFPFGTSPDDTGLSPRRFLSECERYETIAASRIALTHLSGGSYMRSLFYEETVVLRTVD